MFRGLLQGRSAEGVQAGKVFKEVVEASGVTQVGPSQAMLTALSRGQGNGTGEARDMYVPNPSCRDFAKYEIITPIYVNNMTLRKCIRHGASPVAQ